MRIVIEIQPTITFAKQALQIFPGNPYNLSIKTSSGIWVVFWQVLANVSVFKKWVGGKIKVILDTEIVL